MPNGSFVTQETSGRQDRKLVAMEDVGRRRRRAASYYRTVRQLGDWLAYSLSQFCMLSLL